MRVFLVVLCLATFAQAENLERAINRYIAATEEAPPSKPWKITAAFGAAVTDGNSETTTVTTAFEFDKEWERWSIDIDIATLYAEDDGDQSANEAALLEVLKYKIDEKQNLFQLLGIKHDDEAALKYRITFTVGYERRLVKNEKLEIWGNIGGGVVHEEYREEDNTEGTAQAGVTIKWQITEQLSYEGAILFFPSLSESGEFRAIFTNKFETPISDRMKFRLEINDAYNSQAPPDREKNDLTVIFSLAIDFTKKTEAKE